MTDSGLLVLDKPGGVTSHDVVARVRRILGTRKVGHAGTLDPMATGVLVVGVNRATRLLGHLALRDKRYLATIRLGAATISDDRDVDVVTTADPDLLADLADDRILAAAERFIGTLEQRPSSVSAVKVDGRRAYERVRSGEDVVLASRSVTITRLDVMAIARTSAWIDLDIDVECSTGTYIRAIARDLGEALALGGHLVSLRRTRVGPFDTAISLDLLDDLGPAALTSMDVVARTCFPLWQVDADEARAVAFGQRLAWPTTVEAGAPTAVIGPDGSFLALAVDDAGTARYLAVLT